MKSKQEKTEKVKDGKPVGKEKKSKLNLANVFLPRYRSVVLTFLLDIGFVVGAFWLARFSLFYKVPPATATNYPNFEIPLMIIMVAVPISLLALFDCYNVVWKYAGRVEFLKFMASYLVSFVVLLIVKAIVGAAFNVDLWVTQILLFLLYSLVLTCLFRFSNIVIRALPAA